MSSSHLHIVPEPPEEPNGKGGGFGGGKGVPPKSKLPNQNQELKASAGGKKQRERNKQWDACVEVLGYEPRTRLQKGLWGRVIRSLKEAGIEADEIRKFAVEYHRRWPNVDLTITAIEKWIDHFQPSTKRVILPPCPRCGVGGGRHLEDCEAG